MMEQPEMVGREAAQRPWPNNDPGAGWDDAYNESTQEMGPSGGAAASYFGNGQQAFPPPSSGNEPYTPWNTHEQGFNQQPGRFNAPSFYNAQKNNLLAPRVGFTIAGTCIAAGTLILLLVFALARTLPQNDAAQTNQQTGQSSQAATASTPTPEPTTAPSPTPSPTLGDQHYFSGAQLGSEINNNTAQLVTPTNSFKLHQKIFVTFQVHTGTQVGAACLLWHWGNNSQSQFQFQLQGSSGSAYSFMPAEASGAGKVEIYYASTTDCSDKMLEQTADFSVGA
jgi:hypothetical protein